MQPAHGMQSKKAEETERMMKRWPWHHENDHKETADGGQAAQDLPAEAPEAAAPRQAAPFDIGIVGWWFSSNYGSILTYYSLCSVLQDMGLKPLLVPITKVDGLPWEPETQQAINFLKKHFLIGRERSFSQMFEFNQLCDSFMLGSDQLWVPVYYQFLGYTFFLDFVEKDKKKIAFSTSLGRNDFETDEETLATTVDFLNRFDAISVREKNGVQICRKRFGLQVDQVFDPVFLCGRERYEALADQVSDERPARYLLCYILDPTPEKEAAAVAIAEREQLEILTIPGMRESQLFDGKWQAGKLLRGISVEQFLYYIRHADYLLTDSHHGTCFGIIFHRPYVAIVNSDRGGARFQTVASVLGLTDRLVEKPGSALHGGRYRRPIDYDQVDALLKTEKERAMEWLRDALAKPTGRHAETERTMKVENARRATRTGAEPETLKAHPEFKKILTLVTLLRDYGVRHIVLSPGGRDVPLVRMFEYNQDQFVLHSVTDERSAGYYGLGIAAQLQQPVACVCTSGTAVSNYLPAVTEAYYTGVPLIMITADRYEIFHEQGEDQTIPQRHVFRDVIRKEITLPEGDGYYADYQTRRDVSECILETVHHGFGPVHINVPINNIPLGARVAAEHWRLPEERIPRHLLRVSPCDGDGVMMRWVSELLKSRRVLVVYGQNPPPTEEQKKQIERFAASYNCVIVTDFISNLDCACSLKPYNMLNAISQQEFNDSLAPEILVSVGGKRLMNDPLTYKVRQGPGSIRHWSVTPDGKVRDFYFRLTSVIEATQDYFFRWFADHAGENRNDGEYYRRWKEYVDRYPDPAPDQFSAHYVQSRLIPSVPAGSLLHLAVGQSFFDSRRYHLQPGVQVFCNMGTNGIDGCTSTFLGQCAVAEDRRCFLLVGDLSFFYDMNSVWNKPLNSQIRILMVNNRGTGLLRGHGLKAVTSAHSATAWGWVTSVGFEYISADTKEAFDRQLPYFLGDRPKKALFFEVFC